MAGGRAAPEAMDVAAQEGLSLAEHQSQPVTDPLVRQADVLVAMTRSHRQALLAEWPQAAGRTHLLSRSGGDVADPIGGSPEQYRRCAAQIKQELEPWVAEWVGEFQLE